jgi:capsular exopolysaccharide synthesis family protein
MYSSNNSEQKINSTTDEFLIKDIIGLLRRYKVSIVSVTLLIFLLSIFIAVFKSNVYKANLMLHIEQEDKGNTADDLIAKATGAKTGNTDDEIAVIKSRTLIQKALENLQIGTHYYISKSLKTEELYQNNPFQVESEYISKRGQNTLFHVHLIDQDHFSLVAEPSRKTKFINSVRSLLGNLPEDEQPISFSQRFSFGSTIDNPDFKFIISKTAAMDNSDYYFTVTPNEDMYESIQSSLDISPISINDREAIPSGILILSYKDGVPKRAEEILHAIAQAYANQNTEIKEAAAKQRLKFIDEQLISINNSLQNSATHLKDYKSGHAVIDLNDKARISETKIDQLETKLSELDMQQSVLKNLLNYLNNNKEVTGIDVGATDIATSPILSLIEKIQAANTLYASLVVQYTDKHPSVIQVKQQIASLKASLRGTLESSLRGIEQRKETLNHIIEINKQSLEGMPEEEQRLSELTRSFMVNNKVFEYLLEKRIETAIAKSSTISGVRIIDDALVDEKPTEPKRMLIVIVGLVLGFMLGIIQAVIRNMFANTIQNISDLEKRTNIPLYATLPFYGSKKSLYEDSLRVLLTKFEFMKTKPKVITITSSVQGEGKTTTALEFATIIGKSGKKAIVLDMDMRGSGINKKVKINSQGISGYLSGVCTLTDIIHEISVNTHVVVSGTTPENPYQLIMSEGFATLLKYLQTEYDYVILESPPAGLVADALALIRFSDLCLVIFKANYSKKDFIYNMNRFAQEHDLNNMGIILNGLELEKIRPWLRK